jgi:hypothetical protein
MIAVLLPGCCATPTAATAATQPDLGWLVGCWLPDDKDGGGTVELWAAADEGVLHGCSFATESAPGFYELMRIDLRGPVPVFIAQPLGRTPGTRFPLVSAEPQAVTFANEAHDFPQRIRYWREGEFLAARIDGVVDGQPRSASWRWRPRAK